MTEDYVLTIVLQGVELELAPPFTNRELHLIKTIAGVRAGELGDALEARDSDVMVALTHIGLRRAGRARPTLEDLWELSPKDIQIKVPEDLEEEAEAPADPPTAADEPAGGGGNGNPATIPASPGSPTMAPSSD